MVTFEDRQYEESTSAIADIVPHLKKASESQPVGASLTRTAAGLQASLMIPERRNQEWIIPPIFYPLTQRDGTISISKVNHAAVVSFPPRDLCRGRNVHFSELLDCFGCKVLLILELLAPLSWQMIQRRRGDFLFPLSCRVAVTWPTINSRFDIFKHKRL